MKRKFLLAFLIISLVCLFALSVSAEECEHVDNWEVKLSSEGALGDWEAINICPNCNTVLKDEFYEPLVECWGYSYYEDSFAQGFAINVKAVEKYESYTGKSFEYGVVAGVVNVVGNAPVSADGTTASEKAIAFNLSNNNTEHFEIKVVNVPKASVDEKIIACAYVADGGEVLYADGESVNALAAGITYNEVVGLLKNGDVPAGLEEYRKLTAEEMDILFAQYWQSYNSKEYNVRRTTENTPKKFASTRMFTRDELPEGSYVVVGGGWSVRPEVWTVDGNGNVEVQKQADRSDIQDAGTYKIEDWWRDTADKKSGYEIMAFNVSDENGGYVDQMTPAGIAEVLKIYVPYKTKVAKNEVQKAENISVEGMKLLEWGETGLTPSSYYLSTNGTKLSTGNSKFYASPLFNKETLPIGAVIEINEGWSYRDERWINSQRASSRGPMMDAYRIEVTEEFWGNYTQRGFNISTINKEALSKADYETVADAFRIYLPNN